jgi:DNA-binding beta-propeller fold protein YncE
VAFDVVVNPSGTRAYVSNTTKGAVDIVDLNTMAVVGTLTRDGAVPSRLAISNDGKLLYVSNSTGGLTGYWTLDDSLGPPANNEYDELTIANAGNHQAVALTDDNYIEVVTADGQLGLWPGATMYIRAATGGERRPEFAKVTVHNDK